jgi:hypothetical protein
LKKTEKEPVFGEDDTKIEHIHNKTTMNWLHRYKHCVKLEYLYLPDEKRTMIELSEYILKYKYVVNCSVEFSSTLMKTIVKVLS